MKIKHFRKWRKVLEARLYAQEHRVIKLYSNWKYTKKKYGLKDIRYKSAKSAIIVNYLIKFILLSGVSAGFISLLISAYQIVEMREQNVLIQKQLVQNENNNYYERLTKLITILYSEKVSKESTIYTENIPLYHSRIRQEALVEYINMRRKKISYNFGQLSKDKNLSNIVKEAKYEFGIDLAKALLQSVVVYQGDFKKSDLSNANFEDADLFASNFEGSTLSGANFKNANLSSANFKKIYAFNCINFSGANLLNSQWPSDAMFPGANIYGVVGASKEFIEKAQKTGAVQFKSTKDWFEYLNKSNIPCPRVGMTPLS